MSLDSPAAFIERATEIGLGAHLARFADANWTTLATLAFSSPHGGSEEVFTNNILIPGLGAAVHPDAHLLRRLYYEAFMMASADLKRRSDASSVDAIRVMPNAERRERFKRVEDRLKPGIRMRGELEVSYKLVERCVELSDANAIKYLPLELCTKRNDEVRGIEKDPTWATVPDPVSGTLRLKMVRDELRNPLDSQFALLFSFQRRAMALEMADILSFENHELLRDRFVAALMKPPFSGFQSFTLEQVLEADVQFWMLMAEETRDGIRRCGHADRPCDLAFPKVMAHAEFAMAMTPRQLTAPSRGVSRAAFEAPGPPPGPTRSALKRQKTLANKVKSAFERPIQPAGKGGGGGKGNGGAKGGQKPPVKLPPGLQGMCARSSSSTGSKRMCFSYNLGKCNTAGAGQECARGFHLCMKPRGNGGEACSEPHGAHGCTLA